MPVPFTVLVFIALCASCSHLKHGVVFWGEKCPEGTRFRTADDGRRMGKREWCELPRGRIDGVLHGRWRRIWPNGKTRLEGQYDQGKQVGTWTAYQPDGTRLETTEWRADEESGEQQRWHTNGQTLCRGWIREGRRQGHWAGFFASGDKAWVGQFKEGRPYGPWVFYQPNGKVDRKVDFAELKPAAFWQRKTPCPDAARLHGTPPPEGRKVDCREQPKASLTAVLHGPSAELFADGTPRLTGDYDHGNKQGRFIEWRDDGSPRLLETWQQGELSGPRYEWDRDGVLISATRYRAGAAEKTWTRSWCPNGGREEAGDWWRCE